MRAAPDEVLLTKPHLKGQRATKRARKFAAPKTRIVRARVPDYIFRIIESAFSICVRRRRVRKGQTAPTIQRPDFVGEYLQCQLAHVCEDFFPGLTPDEVAALQKRGYTISRIETLSRQRLVDRRAAVTE